MQAQDYADLYALEDGFWWFEGMRAITATLLDPLCAPGADRRVLDAGCGTGANLGWLRRYAGRGRVIGIDLASTALRFSRQRGHGALAQASVTDLPFATQSFDLLTSFDVLGQPPGADADERALREIHRVLRPGGVAFVRVAAYEWMRSGHDEALAIQRRYTLGELTRKMDRAGLRVARATYANGLLLPVAAARRLVLARIGLVRRGSDVKPLSPAWRGLNALLTAALRTEARFLRRPRARLGAGLSAICLARRPLR